MSASFTATVKRMYELKRATVLKFNCTGCMAHVHELEYVGRVVGFERSKFVGPVAVIELVKKGDRDIRGGSLGADAVAIHDSCLQRISDKLFFWYT